MPLKLVETKESKESPTTAEIISTTDPKAAEIRKSVEETLMASIQAIYDQAEKEQNLVEFDLFIEDIAMAVAAAAQKVPMLSITLPHRGNPFIRWKVEIHPQMVQLLSNTVQ